MLYYGWLTATPLEEGFLEIYQKSAMYWLITSGCHRDHAGDVLRQTGQTHAGVFECLDAAGAG